MVLRRLPGRKYGAFDAYKAAIAIAPDRADIYFNMGNILREDLQSFDLAVKAYQFSLQLIHIFQKFGLIMQYHYKRLIVLMTLSCTLDWVMS